MFREQQSQLRAGQDDLQACMDDIHRDMLSGDSTQGQSAVCQPSSAVFGRAVLLVHPLHMTYSLSKPWIRQLHRSICACLALDQNSVLQHLGAQGLGQVFSVQTPGTP